MEFQKWGPFAGLALLLIVVLAGLWLWISRHEGDFRKAWRAFLARPRVAALARRFERQLRFLQNRLTPGGYLGLHLTIGALVIVITVVVFGEIAEELQGGSQMVDLDLHVSKWMEHHRTPTLTVIAHIVTALGSGELVTLAGLATMIILWRWRAWYRLLAFGLAVFGGALLNHLLKISYQRARPIFEEPLVSLSSFSFPSGHTMGATLLYGALALSAMLYAPHWRWRSRLLALFGAILVIVFVAITRVYLGAHFLSDVIAATVVGIAWLTATHTGVEIFRLRKEERKRSPETASTSNP